MEVIDSKTKNQKKEVGKEVEQQEKDKKFLFVDDNKEFLSSLQRFLSNYKFVLFEECHSVEEALAAVLKHMPDVLFLDNDLQGKNTNDGIEVINIIKNKGLDMKIYSMTSSRNPSVLGEYGKRNIEIVSKLKILDIANVIREEISQSQKKDKQ